ncbi:MAG: hypothetical protein E5V66_11090 [Mesorhizobium sp.]|uniref:hypothetical protein n=1 Tax=Mesorhizobium sp. TaxID=1871066 RepID=UPI0011FACAA9|nr:hypothetical protein [Mesorhizobium sp.]TIW11987.1 MAG: hypothetical protein E5V66_11090 [Mesorhizobium sp.]
MSGVLSAISLDAISILTDGAVYDRDGVLLAIRRKVKVSDRLPLAVAFRGNFVFGEVTAHQIISAAEAVGFDRTLADLEADLPNMPASPDLEILIAGISESAGPMQRVFRNKQMGGFEPHTLVDPGPMHWGLGSDGRAISLASIGIPAPRKDETVHTWLSRYGVNVFEFFRLIAVPLDPDDENTSRQHLVGGLLDLTVIKPGSVSTTLLHRWPDKVGEKIDPFRHDAREAA